MVYTARNVLFHYLLITCEDPDFPSKLRPNAPSAPEQLVQTASAFCVETECTVPIPQFTQGINPKHEKKVLLVSVILVNPTDTQSPKHFLSTQHKPNAALLNISIAVAFI